MRQAILVLGMHRSGTSALTRVLSLLGAALPKHMIGAGLGNEAGHWEPERLTVLHDQMLAEAGSRWDDWRAFNPAALPPERIRHYKTEIARHIDEEYGDAPLLVLKDPRICRFVSLYADVLAAMEIDTHYILATRNPLAVMASLTKRNGFTPGYGALLWLRHTLDAEHATRGAPRALLSYESLMHDWRGGIDRVTRTLAIDWPRPTHEAAADVGAFLSPELRHHAPDNAQLLTDKRVTQWVKDTYTALAAVEQSADDNAALATLDRIKSEFDAAAPIFGDPFYGELAARQRLAEERANEIARIGEKLAQQRNDSAAREALLTQQKDALQKENATLRSSMSWKLTYPIRMVGIRLFKTRQKARSAQNALRMMRPALCEAAKNPIWGAHRAIEISQIFSRDGWAGVKALLIRLENQASQREPYLEWSEQYDSLNDMDRQAILAHIGRLTTKPVISIIMPVYNPHPQFLDIAIRSARRQLYPHWELCIADDASTDSEIRSIIQRHADEEPRIKPIFRTQNGHICAATNSALEVASGEFVALMDHDDLIPEHALYWVAAEIENHPHADIIYTDSDLIDDKGNRHCPYFKTDFNLELMLGHNMVSHFGIYRRSLVSDIGGMRLGLEGSQDYDLFLRAFSNSSRSRIRHIPAILYHWRRSIKAPSYSASTRALDSCVAAAKAAIEDFLADRSISATVLPAPKAPTWQRIAYSLPAPPPKVSVIIPSKDRVDLLKRCTDGILNHTNYPSIEVIIMDNNSVEAKTLELFEQLKKDPRVKVFKYPQEFNFSAINNEAVNRSSGDVLLFLNNDIEILEPDWLSELASRAVIAEAGAVGATLLYPDGRIQHAGVATGMGQDRIAGHIYCSAPRDWPGYVGEMYLAREVSAVTAACMAIRRSVFLAAGGFDEVNLRVAYNDVDLCLRVRDMGYVNVVTPFAELIHHESSTRGSDLAPENRERFIREVSFMKQRWSYVLEDDPYFSPNFSLDFAIPEFASPPRHRRPWIT